MVHSGILTEEKKLTEHAKKKFIQDVLDIIEHGSEDLPNKPLFQCGDPIPANPIKNALPDLFDEKIYSDFHKNTLGLYEKIAVALDLESNFSLLPVAADPIALAGKFGVELPQLKFPEGFIPYVTGMLIPKLAIDLVLAGKTEFLLPVKLAQKLPSLIGIPTPPKFDPPQLTLPPPLFNIPNVPADLLVDEDVNPEQPIVKLNISPPQVPDIPNEVLKELFSVNLSVVESIPKLVGDLIAKIPEIASKLPDIMVVVGDICKLIRDSNVFGKSEPTSTIQHAVNFVLARKTAECVLGGVIATTIGSSPGSIAPTVVSTISGAKPGPGNHDAHTPQPQPEATPTPPYDPVKWMISASENMVDTSYGDAAKVTQYLNGLFYIERAMISSNTSSKRNIFANLATDQTATFDNSSVKGESTLIAKPADILEKIPIDDSAAFYKAAGIDALLMSSCGMFLRACYAASTIPNDFFRRQYVPGSAISTFKHIGIMRNYWWTAEKTPKGNLENPKKPLLSYFLNEGGKINLGRYNHFVGTRLTDIDGSLVPNVPIGKLQRDINGDVFYTDDKDLTAALKSSKKELAELAIIEGNTLTGLTAGKGAAFPALEKGDALLLMRIIHPNPEKKEKFIPYLAPGGEHALFITQDRAGGWEIVSTPTNSTPNHPSATDLVFPIRAAEGGYLDGRNKPYFDTTQETADILKAMRSQRPGEDDKRHLATAQFLAAKSLSENWYAINVMPEIAKELNQSFAPPSPLDDADTLKNAQDVTAAKAAAEQKAKLKPRSTAIANVVYNRATLLHVRPQVAAGEDEKKIYFAIGCSIVRDTLGEIHVGLQGKGDGSLDISFDKALGPGNQFAIVAIYKARNYIAEIPYLAVTVEGQADANIASTIMDDHPDIFLFSEANRQNLILLSQYYAFPQLLKNLIATNTALKKAAADIAAISTPAP